MMSNFLNRCGQLSLWFKKSKKGGYDNRLANKRYEGRIIISEHILTRNRTTIEKGIRGLINDNRKVFDDLAKR